MGYKIQNTFLEAAGSLYFVTKNTRALQARPAFFTHTHSKLHQTVADGEKRWMPSNSTDGTMKSTP